MSNLITRFRRILMGDEAQLEAGGDFTTCQLSFINNSEDSYTLDVAHSYEDTTLGSVQNDGFGGEETVSVILYKGNATAIFPSGNAPASSDVSVTGAIEYNEESDSFLITGDGTITIGD